ncbi:MAG: hypothetical protein IT381_28435 [Deltaproteobacteria bacterium]|nr:hypothetical protein [Deltaproteobacteria bacterium]
MRLVGEAETDKCKVLGMHRVEITTNVQAANDELKAFARKLGGNAVQASRFERGGRASLMGDIYRCGGAGGKARWLTPKSAAASCSDAARVALCAAASGWLLRKALAGERAATRARRFVLAAEHSATLRT